ncbi:MAG TPA: hydrolase [Gemmatimonadaceae bacterium]|nr:hydrolase [Gemmatimonadaceae bacterium]
MTPQRFSAAWWLPGPHAQTLWGKLFRRQPPHPTHVQRLDTPDGDFLEIHHTDGDPGAPRLVLLHGLEGTIRSHYLQSLLGEAERRGWAASALIFRSCGPEMNRTRRFYHSGETSDLAFALERILVDFPESPILLAGVSLGGNVLLKFLGESGTNLDPRIIAAAAVSVPFDLRRGSRHIERGFSRVYGRHFIRSLSRKATVKLQSFPDLVDPVELASIRTMYDFDNRMTARLHGFKDADDYYSKSSSLGWLGRISIDTLLLSAVDDPFLPPEVLDEVREIARANPALHLEFTPRGGHAGFVGGRNPFNPVYYIEHRVGGFLAERLAHALVGRDAKLNRGLGDA